MRADCEGVGSGWGVIGDVERCGHARGRACVSKAYGDYLIFDILDKEPGHCVAVTDVEIMDALRQWARVEGVFAAPEGAAALAGYRNCGRTDSSQASDTVVLFNTGSGLKYLDTLETNGEYHKRQPTRRQIAGIIGPY